MKLSVLFLVFLSAARSFASFDDSKCDSDLKEFDDALMNRELWALRFFDTWGKIQSGILHGNNNNPGHFSDCVKFRHKELRGQHCMVVTTPKENETLDSNDARFDWREVGALARVHHLSLVVGVCLPASCSTVKVLEYSSAILSEADLLALVATCRTNDPVPFRAIDIFAVIFFSLLVALVAASTAYEVVTIRKNRKPDELLSSFSVYTSGAKLFVYSKTKSPNAINCLDGLKTLSIFWIILGHRFGEMVPLFNQDESVSFRKDFLYLIYTNYDKPVETFFVIAGLLVTWSMLKALDNKTVNVPRMILHRWLRYTPSLAMIILFNLSLIKLSGSGPFFNPYTAACEKYWWSSLLHISVYLNPLEICYEVSWYLAVDFQLFIISPLLIYPLWKLKRKLYWILPTLVVLVQCCIFTTVYMNEITVFIFEMGTWERFTVWLSKWYFPSHLRLGAWLVGIMLGFIMHETRGRKVEINKVVDAVLWFTSLSVILSVILCMYPFIQVGNDTSRFSNALYNSVFRVAWSYAVAWIIFSCHNGSGGIVRWFLSLKQWQLLGKMGLSIYLVHRMYQIVTNLNEKQPIYWDFFTQLQKFYGDLFVSIFLGAALYLAVETPVLKIENFLYKKIKSK